MSPGADEHNTRCSTCEYCGKAVALVVELGISDGKAYILPDDPVVVEHPEAPDPMHKKCAANWVEEHDCRPVNVGIRLRGNTVGQGGRRLYFPADTPVRRIEVKPEDKSFRLALEKESARGCVLVAAGYLDGLLEELLISYFPNKKAARKLVDGYMSPLGSFSSRIKAAFAIGLIVAEEKRQLEVIRSIRNGFAHDFTHCDFGDQSIKDQVGTLPKNLFVSTGESESTRGCFEQAVGFLIANLRYRAEFWSKEPPPPPELPWLFPIDEAGLAQLDEHVTLAVELADPWVQSLREPSSKDAELAESETRSAGTGRPRGAFLRLSDED